MSELWDHEFLNWFPPDPECHNATVDWADANQRGAAGAEKGAFRQPGLCATRSESCRVPILKGFPEFWLDQLIRALRQGPSE